MEMHEFHSFLAQRLALADAILIDRICIERQLASARVLKAYTSRHEGLPKYSSGEMTFVGTPGSWGNPTLSANDKAVAFIGYIESAQGYYQHHWLAHFLVIVHGGQEYALATWNTHARNWWPASFHDQCIIPDSSRPWRVGIPFSLFEKHLLQLIDEPAPNIR
ncbi:hypothetical protein [Chitinimonas sp.]|uniref:hypothetical protein n=1 Tax=Chitinimonas sp. TaxID=1934313 RepID=UPI0035AFBCD9